MWRRCFSSNINSTRTLNEKKWDALVIGAGHNGLTAAAYLARSGFSVAVLERRHIIGGAAITEELVPGFKFSRCSYVQSLLRPSIIKDLELAKHGLKLLKMKAATFTPCVDGRYLLLNYNQKQNYKEISRFSKRDADAFPRYESQLIKFCEVMDFLLDSLTPETLNHDSSFTDRLRDKLNKSVFWGRFLHQALSLGQKDLVDFVDLLLSPTSKVEMLDDWNSIGNEISLAASCLGLWFCKLLQHLRQSNYSSSRKLNLCLAAWNWDSGISISIPGSNSTVWLLKT